MFKPVRVPNFTEKLNSMFVAGITLNGGACVSVDPTDAAAINGSYGYGALRAGSLKLATIDTNALVPREFGIALVDATPGGPSVIERILRLASSYLKIPQGLNMAVYTPAPGDVFGTAEYVGNLSTDSGATGAIDLTDTTKMGAACEVYQGRIRLHQGSNPIRFELLGKTNAGGAVVAMFRSL